MNVLVVEDNTLTAYLLKEFLLQEGFEACQAPDAAKAIEFLRLNQFDAIVMDYCLPGLDGASLLGALRNDPKVIKGKTIPVIVITGLDKGMVDTLREPLEMYNPVVLLQKPTNPKKIVEEIRRLAREQEAKQAIAGKPPTPKA